MTKIIESDMRFGVILKICSASDRGGKGDNFVVIVEHDSGDIGEYPLRPRSGLSNRQRVVVASITEKIGNKGGSLTKFCVSPETI